MDVSLSELLAVQEMSFQSPLPSLRNRNDENSLQFNHVELEDIMKAQTIPDELKSILKDAGAGDQDCSLLK